MRHMRLFWRQKLIGNVRRDRRNRRILRRMGYRTITIWDDELDAGLRRLKKLVANLGSDPLHHKWWD